MRRLWAIPVSFAALFGAIFGGGSTAEHATRLTGVPTTPQISLAPSAGGLFMSGMETVQRLHDEAQAAELARQQAEIDRLTAEEAERFWVEQARINAPVVRSGCCGSHSDAWWWGVAVCEQGGRNDPYFGYFSFMDGSAGGKTWEEQVAMGNALLARAGREIGPWAESCIRAGYTASPGG